MVLDTCIESDYLRVSKYHCFAACVGSEICHRSYRWTCKIEDIRRPARLFQNDTRLIAWNKDYFVAIWTVECFHLSNPSCDRVLEVYLLGIRAVTRVWDLRPSEVLCERLVGLCRRVTIGFVKNHVVAGSPHLWELVDVFSTRPNVNTIRYMLDISLFPRSATRISVSISLAAARRGAILGNNVGGR